MLFLKYKKCHRENSCGANHDAPCVLNLCFFDRDCFFQEASSLKCTFLFCILRAHLWSICSCQITPTYQTWHIVGIFNHNIRPFKSEQKEKDTRISLPWSPAWGAPCCGAHRGIHLEGSFVSWRSGWAPVLRKVWRPIILPYGLYKFNSFVSKHFLLYSRFNGPIHSDKCKTGRYGLELTMGRPLGHNEQVCAQLEWCALDHWWKIKSRIIWFVWSIPNPCSNASSLPSTWIVFRWASQQVALGLGCSIACSITYTYDQYLPLILVN